jgi:tetratricopeptide (TPR) repeat protein
MALFDLFKKNKVNPEDIDYISKAEELEKKGDFASAIEEYKKLIEIVFKDKPLKTYRHIIKKIVDCYIKIGDYEKVFELWPSKYDSSDYGGKEMYELIKILEQAQRNDLISKVYDQGGKKLTRNKIEYLIKQHKIPEANALLSEFLTEVSVSSPAIEELWMTKSKLCLSLTKWDEACKYLNKIIEKNPHNSEARKLKEFCLRQVRSS